MRGYYGSKYSPGEPVKFIIEKAKGKAFEGYSVYATNGQQKQKRNLDTWTRTGALTRGTKRKHKKRQQKMNKKE